RERVDRARARAQRGARASQGRRRRLRLGRDGRAVRGRGADRLMFHSLLQLWFRLSLEWGYAGIFTLMAIESTVFPLPSEVVVPPAAYGAEQGRFLLWGVVAGATLGSWAGAAISYCVARAAGRPLILRFGRYVFVPEKKWLLAEQWIRHYSVAGIFFSRLLP